MNDQRQSASGVPKTIIRRFTGVTANTDPIPANDQSGLNGTPFQIAGVRNGDLVAVTLNGFLLNERPGLVPHGWVTTDGNVVVVVNNNTVGAIPAPAGGFDVTIGVTRHTSP